MVEVEVVEGLSGALLAVASDPARIGSLYQILGEYCHRLRNQLNGIEMSKHLVCRGAVPEDPRPWEVVDRSYRSVLRIVDQLQAILSPRRLSPVRLPLEIFLQDRRPIWEGWLAARERRLIWLPPAEPVVGDFDPARLAQGLDALAAWRSEVGRTGSTVRVQWWAEAGQIRLEWDEPGAAGIAEEGPPGDQPASLALPVLARVLTDHQGSLEVSVRDGLRLSLSWPIELRAA